MSAPSPAGFATQPVELAVFALVGLLGGAHCLGMCGPLVTFYADRLDPDDGPVAWPAVRQHLLFNAGRTGSYTAIGAAMGLLGAATYEAAAVAAIADDVRGVAGLLVGGFVVATGANYVRTGTAANLVSGGGGAFERLTAPLLRRVDTWVRGPRIVGLGAVHGLLPCPLLYPAFLYALATGSPVRGALSLAVLGLGTVPAVFAYGVAFQSAAPRLRGPLHRALGIAFLLLGLLPLAHGLSILGVPVPHPNVPVYQPLG